MRRKGSAHRKFQRLKKRMMNSSNGKCFYCLVEMVPGRGAQNDPDNVMTVDHLIPRSEGGLDVASNLVVCCRKCNLLRATKKIKDFLLDEHPWRLYPKEK